MWAGPPRSDQSGLRKQRTGLRTELDQQGASEVELGTSGPGSCSARLLIGVRGTRWLKEIHAVLSSVPGPECVGRT